MILYKGKKASCFSTVPCRKIKGRYLNPRHPPFTILHFSIQGLFLNSSLRRSSYPLILRAYRNIGKPYTMAWQIPLLLYFFCSSNFIFPLLLSSSLNTKISHFFAPLTDFLYSDEGFYCFEEITPSKRFISRFASTSRS